MEFLEKIHRLNIKGIIDFVTAGDSVTEKAEEDRDPALGQFEKLAVDEGSTTSLGLPSTKFQTFQMI